MSDSLRDQLLGLGFKPAPKPERKPDAQARKPAHAAPHAKHYPKNQARPHANAKPQDRPKSSRPPREDIELAKAYALRAQREKDERIEAERKKQEEARQRREAKARLAELLQGKALNVADAEIARHFPYGGKIKRLYVTEAQLRALNAGELGVVQLDGRYLLVAADVLAQAEAVFAPAVALKVDPSAPAGDDPYADPQYQVPDDLVW
ncbi:MAG: DUF2058 family protein [Lysobacter sp.]|nr:DUF2058 family protein [Lysobacter sp.]